MNMKAAFLFCFSPLLSILKRQRCQPTCRKKKKTRLIHRFDVRL